jgi:hypothetical protein
MVMPLSGVHGRLAKGFKMQRHHKVALARLTRLLHTGDPEAKRLPKGARPGSDPPASERTIEGQLWQQMIDAQWVAATNANTIVALPPPRRGKAGPGRRDTGGAPSAAT